MHNFSPYLALAGGALIGLSATLFLLTHGRITGISGLLGGLIRGADKFHVRLAFIAGLLAGGVALRVTYPSAFIAGWLPNSSYAIPAGLLVGFGTQLGNGCTSGHGICGVGRLSPRSLAATATFMLTGLVTVFVARHLLGGVR